MVHMKRSIEQLLFFKSTIATIKQSIKCVITKANNATASFCVGYKIVIKRVKNLHVLLHVYRFFELIL